MATGWLSARSATDQTFPKNDVIIPRKTILELQRLLEDSEDPVRIDFSGAQVRFVFGDVELISKLVEGKFPDVYTRHSEGIQKPLHRSA